jgi:hypothetical protein
MDHPGFVSKIKTAFKKSERTDALILKFAVMGEGAECGAAGAGAGQRSTRARRGPGLYETTPCRVTEATTAGAAKDEVKAQTETTSSAKTSTMTATVENPQETSPMAIASVATPQTKTSGLLEPQTSTKVVLELHATRAAIKKIMEKPRATTTGDERPRCRLHVWRWSWRRPVR